MGRKTENIDRYECKEKMIPGAWKSRTGFGRDNTGVIMGEASALGRKPARLLAAGLALALLVSSSQPALAQEEPATTYEQYISGEYREENDTKQYETLRITSVEELQDLSQACAYEKTIAARLFFAFFIDDVEGIGAKLQIYLPAFPAG